MEERRGEFLISTDAGRLDAGAIHAFLTRGYWAEGIPLEVVQRSIRGSLCFGVYEGERQIGLARVITDRATFAYLADVYILEHFRGRGLGKWLMECIKTHPELQNLRRWLLATRDAHGLYRQFGFHPPRRPENLMELHDATVYSRPEKTGN
jgi:GNAT superfamily N-acetyltransferase